MTGKVNTAYAPNGAGWLTKATGGGLEGGDRDFTLATWMRMVATNNTYNYAGVGTSSTSYTAHDYGLRYTSGKDFGEGFGQNKTGRCPCRQAAFRPPGKNRS